MEWTFERLSRGDWTPPLVGSFVAERGLCGVSGNFGLLRFHDSESGPIAQGFVSDTFGTLGITAEVFAFDWRARQIAITTSFDDDGEYTGGEEAPMIVTLDPSEMTADPWCMPIEYFERALSTSVVEDDLLPGLFNEWRAAAGVHSLTLDECAGVTVPGFYNGPVAVGNLELNDVDVYLTFIAQLWAKARLQKPGAPAPYLEG